MDFLKGALEQYQQHSSAVTDNHEDKEVLNNSLNNVAQSGVAPPQESDIHAANAAHNKVYQQGDSQSVSDEDLGKAAGVEAFKAYEKSEASDSDGESGGGQGKLIQMAMAEAMKLFSGGGGSDKSAVVQSAIAMATKLFMGKSGESGGGVSQLIAMISGGGKGGDGEGGSNALMGMLGKASENPQVADMLKKFM
ncbi:hypothetical protein EDD11_001812 [Mortierella claussenii]|nr:hypothetical protein EDD11_001812 [Mortierella claussenii]